MGEFSGKVAVVTGGAAGAGAAIADAFVREGASVAVADIDDAAAFPTDVADPEQCATLIDGVWARFGRLDVLVNCAGIFGRTPAVDIDPDEWDRMFAVNVYGAFHCSQAAARRWIAADQPGAIVNISSTASTHFSSGVTAYAATKAALSSLTRSLGVEWAPHRIRVNAVAPSHINVARLREVGAAGIVDLEAIARSIPMGRLAEPEEVADAVLFLAGDKAGFVTSQVLFVDGGFSVPPIYRYEQS
jgi:NAD(P)-dependent dehydrogenase (short-subunit alcohol dehydrogenase family)